MWKWIYLILLLPTCIYSQSSLTIGMIIEGEPGHNADFERQVKEEITALMENRKILSFETFYTGYEYQKTLEEVELLMQSDVDIILTLGLTPSNILAKQDSYPIPSVAGIILDPVLQDIPQGPNGTSGIHNLSYILSPFNVQRDLEVFKSIYDYKKLGILVDNVTLQTFPLVGRYFDQIQEAHEIIVMEGNLDSDIHSIPNDIDALYVLPLNSYADAELPLLMKSMADHGLPTFSLMGRPFTEIGGMASLAPSNFLPTYARRLALNVLKITEGIDPAELPIHINGLSEDFVINMATVRNLNIYPDFDVLNQATLLNIDLIESDRKMNIRTAILEALENNLDYAFSRKDVDISEQDIKIAQANLYPQLDAHAMAAIADQNNVLADGSSLNAGNYSVGANLSQLIFSEPAYANIAIQKIVKKQNQSIVDQTSLDIILDAAQAYLGYLQAKTLVRINNQNVNVTKQNLTISRSKNELGYSSNSDVFRLESQLAQNSIDLNGALAQMNQAAYALNQILNRPQSEKFEVSDIDLRTDILPTANADLESAINNQRDFNLFMDFMIAEAQANLPELEQVRLAIKLQERLLKSNQRSIYTPQLALSGGYNKTLGYFNLPDGLDLTTSPTWNAGLNLSLPIFQGGLRKANIEQNKVQIEQLNIQQDNLSQQFELALRSNLENLSNSYTRLTLSQDQANAAFENFKIVQDLYRQGQTNIITLIDAQTSYLQADLSAANAIYQFVSDFLAVERYTGQYYFLMDPAEKSAWVDRFKQFLITKK